MKYKIAILILIGCIGICGIFIGQWLQRESREEKPYQSLAEVVRTEQIDEKTDRIQIEAVAQIDDVNAEIIGWIRNGVYINYPIAATDDESFYLSHDVYHDENRAGAIFCLDQEAFSGEYHNTVLYGHNMAQGRTDMFSTLLRYKDQKYYQENKTITVDTPSTHEIYEIFAAFPINTSRDGFVYTASSFADAEEYYRFVNEAKAYSTYETEIDTPAGSPLLTLVTCDRSADKMYGRYIVMAVKR